MNQKGFTIVEVMVALATMAVLLAIIGSFLMYTGRYARARTQQVDARERIYLGLEMIRQDIMQAGIGLRGTALADSDPGSPMQLAVKMTNDSPAYSAVAAGDHPKGAYPRGFARLYLSYGRYLKTKWPVDPNVVDPTSATCDNPNIFTHFAWKKVDDATQSAGDPVTLSSSLGLSVAPACTKISPYDIGYLLGSDGSVIQLDPQMVSSTFSGTYTYTAALTSGTYYVPAVSYACVNCGTADTDLGAIVKNVDVSGSSTVILGPDPNKTPEERAQSNIKVTALRVGAQFPGEGALRPNDSKPTILASDWPNLKFIEVRVVYQVRTPTSSTSESEWSDLYAAVVRAVPRLVQMPSAL